jgi:hypothetical protein
MKLVDIPVVFICPDHNEKYSARKQHMFQLLESIGFKSVTHFKSGNENYPTCLVKASIDVLNNHLDDEPVIILEDDIEPYLEIGPETELDLPEDTDAFYLGLSVNAGSKTENVNVGSAQIEKISDKHIRIYNMLGGHAILYKGLKYKERVIQVLTDLLDKPHYYNDVVISRIQSEYKIYGYYYPIFYQSRAWGGDEIATKFTYT